MAKQTIPVAILVRVSTDEQDNARQVSELREVANRAEWDVIEVIREQGVSGASRIRPGLARLLELAECGKVRKVLVHEVSRLSRHPAVLHDAVERLNEAGVSLYWHSQRAETLLPDGERNPATGMMLAILGEMARSERESLSKRTKSGLAEARRRGRTLGRPVGSTISDADLVAKHPDIAKLVRAKLSIRKIAKLTDKAPGTVQAVKRAMS
jgi:DNA invertase Pin-like site-specific DNA recombinase